MTARQIRWFLAITAIATELISFVAWRLWLQHHRAKAAA